MAMLGYRVLLVDLDAQATLTRLCGLQPKLIKVEQTFCSAIGIKPDDAGDITIEEPSPLNPVGTHISGLDIIPASSAVHSIEDVLMGTMASGGTVRLGNMFKDALGAIDGDYDFVLFDCERSLSLSQLI